jgi:hypothetical protein
MIFALRSIFRGEGAYSPVVSPVRIDLTRGNRSALRCQLQKEIVRPPDANYINDDGLVQASRKHHAGYYWLLLAESHLPRRLFGSILRRIVALPLPAGSQRESKVSVTMSSRFPF